MIMTSAMTSPTFEFDNLRQHVEAIRRLGKQTVENVIEIGGRLIECKEIVGHGNFGLWLRTEFDWTDQTARRFMQVAELAKTNNLLDLELPLSSLYLLSAPSTPQKVVDAVFERAKTEPVKHSEVVQLVRDSKDSGKKLTAAEMKAQIETPKQPEAAPVITTVEFDHHDEAEDEEDDTECHCCFCARKESEVNILVRAGRDLEGNPDCAPEFEDCICDDCASKVMRIIGEEADENILPLSAYLSWLQIFSTPAPGVQLDEWRQAVESLGGEGISGPDAFQHLITNLQTIHDQLAKADADEVQP
jgi:hypothetical protein